MGLETGSYISALVATNPVGATDPKSQGDDHIRFIKAKLLETFANVTGAVTASHTELNLVTGATGGLATLSVSFAAAASSIAVLTSALAGFSFTASVTSSDITGSIRAPVLKTQAGYTAGTFTAATVTVNDKGIITKIVSGSTGGTAAAWCTFNGTTAGTNAPTAGLNVSTVTRNSTGNYTINFTNALSSADYAVIPGVCSGTNSSAANLNVLSATQYGGPSNKTTTACQLTAHDYANNQIDLTQAYVVFFI